MDYQHRTRRRRGLWRSVALCCLSVWVWRRLCSLLPSHGRSYGDIDSAGVWPTHIYGAECPVCLAPLVIAWREINGTKHPWRVNVEAVLTCECAGELTPAEIMEP